MLNPDLPKDHLVPVWDTLLRGETYVIEVTNMRADGSRFPVEVHSALLRQDDRDCIVAVARDLSARAEAELRYRELMETVEGASSSATPTATSPTPTRRRCASSNSTPGSGSRKPCARTHG